MNRPATAILPNRGRTWATTDFEVTTSGASETFSLNLYSPVGLLIDWGDGSSDTYNSTGLASHVYATADSYTVKMRGQCQRFAFYGGTPTKVTALLTPIQGISGLTSAQDTYRGCTALTGLVTDLFRYCPNITTFANCFSGCNNAAFTSLPTDLFRYNTAATNFSNTFYGCTGLTSIPADTFRYNTAVTNFSYTFQSCTGLTAIPAGLFDYNVLATTFQQVFYDCTNAALTTIPTDLFRYNVLATNFAYAFRFTKVTTIPADLFRYNVLATLFIGTFNSCNQLTLNPYIFFASGEESTRFLDKSVDFTSCFYRSGTFTGTQGTAPALWDCDYGTGTPTTTDCFQGHDATTVDNYASIPAGWL